MTPRTDCAAAEPDRISAALGRAAHYGRYFEASVGGAAVPEFDVESALGRAGRRLGTGEARVAASSLQYEFAERMWALALGAWAFGRVIPDFAELRYGSTAEGALVVGFEHPRGWDCTGAAPDAVAELLAHQVVTLALPEFHRTVQAVTKIADGLLWGNAAAALVISARSASRARSCTALAALLLDASPLAGRVVGPATGPVRRRSCCLFYRSRARRTCGDCPLPRVPR